MSSRSRPTSSTARRKGELDARKEKVEGVQAVTYWQPDQPDAYRPAFYKRLDYDDQVYININAKFEAVANEIQAMHEQGRPVLVGTGSVEASEELSKRLRKRGLKEGPDYEILNAKNHTREALIIAQAGRPGAITISTSMAGRGTDILLGGNPEGLATNVIADECFALTPFKAVVADVVEGKLDAARQKAATDRHMDPTVVDWIVEENEELVRKASVEDIQGQVIKDLQEDPAYRDVPFSVMVSILGQLGLAQVAQDRVERARGIAEENGLPLSLIPDAQYRLEEYRSLGGLLGQSAHVDVLTRHLFERHYNARAAIVRAVLSDDLDEAHTIMGQLPALPDSLIDGVQAIRTECGDDRQTIWETGGLHVISTERHESRRIDDQLRGRAARQGDPGSSRFYLSLEDELMIRFGGERAKGMMERLNVPEDMPIAANILSGIIESSQGKFETYHFEIRKNLIEYDEAVNRQRQIVYDERRSDSGRRYRGT